MIKLQPRPDSTPESDLYPHGPPAFMMRRLLVRFNPGDDVVINVGSERAKMLGVLSLLGFSPDNALIANCHFMGDASVKPGHVVLEPLR